MAWNVIQSASAASAALTASATYGTALTNGTKLIAFVSNSTSMTISTVKDGSGNSFSQIEGPGAGNGLDIFVLDHPNGSSTAITATWTGTANGAAILIWEVSGLAAGSTTAAVIDGTAGLANGSSTAATYNSNLGSYTTAVANELLVAFYADDGGATGLGSTGTTPAGYTADANNISSNADDDLRVFYKNSTGGLESPTSLANTNVAGAGTSVTYQTIFAAFKLPAAAAAAASPAYGPVIPPGLQSPMTLATPPRFAIPPAPQQQPAPAPQMIPPGLMSPMALDVPLRPATAAPPAPPPPPTGTPAPPLIPPGLMSPMALDVPARYTQPAPPQQRPAPAPQLIPPGLQSPMSLTAPVRPATSAPPPPPVTAVASPAPMLTPPGLQSPMALAVPVRPATSAPPPPPAPAAQPGTQQLIPPGLQSPMSFGVPMIQPPQAPSTPGPPPPTPPIPSGIIFGAQGSGGDRDHDIRVFRSIMPGEIPATGAELPKLHGRGYAGPLPERADDTMHDWLEEQAPPEPGPSVAEIVSGEAERWGSALYDLGRIIAPEPYTAPGKGKCGAPRKIGREWLTCKLRAGHGGMHSDRGVKWG